MLDKLGGPKRAAMIVAAVVLFGAFAWSLWFLFAGGGEEAGSGGSAAAAGEFPILEFDDAAGASDPLAAAPPPAAALPPPAAAGLPAPPPAYDPGPAATIAALQAQLAAAQGLARPPAAPAVPSEPVVPATPDVAEMVQEAINQDRDSGGVSPVLAISPLDLNRGGRNPYLNSYELDYFELMGEHFWSYSLAWLKLREIVLLDVDSWTADLLAFEVENLNSILNPVRNREITPDSQVGELVVEYGRQLDQGFSQVDRSVDLLQSAVITAVQVGGEPLTDQQRNSFIALRREILQNLENFHRVMASYGCSVCGELFRQSQYR